MVCFVGLAFDWYRWGVWIYINLCVCLVENGSACANRCGTC